MAVGSVVRIHDEIEILVLVLLSDNILEST